MMTSLGTDKIYFVSSFEDAINTVHNITVRVR
jgi:hypothetical protein